MKLDPMKLTPRSFKDSDPMNDPMNWALRLTGV
jgi:hypothetical protein